MSIPREHRLRKHRDFEFVYRCGRRHFSTLLTAFYLLRAIGDPAGADSKPRVGITVGRALGTAVVRNRIKRRMRAAVSENLNRLTHPLDVVINPKKATLNADFRQICSEVARAFGSIESKAMPPCEDKAQQQRSANQHRMTAKRT